MANSKTRRAVNLVGGGRKTSRLLSAHLLFESNVPANEVVSHPMITIPVSASNKAEFSIQVRGFVGATNCPPPPIPAHISKRTTFASPSVPQNNYQDAPAFYASAFGDYDSNFFDGNSDQRATFPDRSIAANDDGVYALLGLIIFVLLAYMS